MNKARVRPCGLLLAAVLTLHVSVLLMLLQLTGRAPASRIPAVPAPTSITWLRLLMPGPDAPAAPEKPGPRPTKAPLAPLAGAAIAPPAVTVQSQAITLPPTVEAPTTAASAALPAPPASAPLDLRLPRVEPAGQPPAALARGDPNRPVPLNASDRFARTLGTDDRLVEEVTASRRRLRKGNGCIDVRPSRASGLDPFNGSVMPKPSLASAC